MFVILPLCVEIQTTHISLGSLVPRPGKWSQYTMTARAHNPHGCCDFGSSFISAFAKRNTQAIPLFSLKKTTVTVFQVLLYEQLFLPFHVKMFRTTLSQ